MNVDKDELQKMVNDAVTFAINQRKAAEEEEILGHQEYIDLYGDILQQCKYYNLIINENVNRHFKAKLIALVKRGYHLQHPNWNSERQILVQIATNNQTK